MQAMKLLGYVYDGISPLRPGDRCYLFGDKGMGCKQAVYVEDPQGRSEPGKLKCGRCQEEFTLKQRADCDGCCWKCGAELDLEDYLDELVGEVERQRVELAEQREIFGMQEDKIDTLRAQLAEAREDRNKLGDRYDAAEAKLAERDALLRAVPAMPTSVDRRPNDKDQPDGYLEGDRSWCDNNKDAVEWLIENHVAIRAALSVSEPAKPRLCEDEGCPHHGVDHVCLTPRQREALKVERDLGVKRVPADPTHHPECSSHKPRSPACDCHLSWLVNQEPTEKTFTVFCQESIGRGTVWIDTVEAAGLEEAKNIGLERCADDWKMDLDEVRVLGVAEGKPLILHWEDIE